MGLQNKIVYLDLKFEDEEDKFNTGRVRPFLIHCTEQNKAYLSPITSQRKKKSFKWQYLVSSLKNPTCLSRKEYPFSYVNLNRKIILKLKDKTLLNNIFCWKQCKSCLPELKFAKLLLVYNRYWRSPLNKLSWNKSKVKTIRITI